MNATRAGELLRLVGSNPVELYDRIRARIEVRSGKRRPARTQYASCDWDGFVHRLRGVPHWNFALDVYERECAEVMTDLAERARSLPPTPFPAIFNGDPVLARLAYVLTRALQPDVVLESGVALGIVSSCVLSALERNGHGRLTSIDLPPLGVAPAAVGRIVPDALRSRWTLLRGTSTRLLPDVTRDMSSVGLFVHDSLFTWRNSTQEYSQVLPHLADQSAIVANCVQHSQAFAWLVEQAPPSMQAVVTAEQKPGELIGVWIRAGDRAATPGAAGRDRV